MPYWRHDKQPSGMRMTWSSFFKSRPFVYGSMTGTLGLTAGAVGTFAFSLQCAHQCASKVSKLESNIGEDFTIPKLTFDATHEDYSKTISLYNLKASFPQNWLDLLDNADKLPHYCFYTPLIIGLWITAITAIVLATYVQSCVHIHDQQEEQRTAHASYMALSNA